MPGLGEALAPREESWLARSGRRAAMLLKVHHAFLDGLGTGGLAFALADGGSPDQVPAPARPEEDITRQISARSSLTIKSE
mgnify:CR=1 FL=1